MKKRIGFLATTLVASIGGSAPAQQVWTVNDDGPADFAAIQDAVDAASDGDVILVREGTYSFVSIDDKSLVLVAEETGEPGGHQIFGVDVDNLAASRRVVVRGFQIDGFLFQMIGLSATGNAGPVVIEDCVFTTEFAEYPVLAIDSDAIYLTRCHLTGRPGIAVLLPIAVPPRPAVLARNSSVYAYESTLTGGEGLFGFPPFGTTPGSDGQKGADAVSLLDGSFLFASGATIRGGRGGKGFDDQGFCFQAGGGGAGVRMAGIGGSTFHRLDSVVLGGLGGAGTGGCSAGASGPDVVAAGGTVTTIPEEARDFEMSALVAEGQNVSIQIQGKPGELVKILYTVSHTGVYAPGLQGGLLIGLPPSLVVLGTIPGTGVMNFVVPLPANLLPAPIEGVSIFAQTLVFGQGNLGLLGSPTVLTIVDSGV